MITPMFLRPELDLVNLIVGDACPQDLKKQVAESLEKCFEWYSEIESFEFKTKGWSYGS